MGKPMDRSRLIFMQSGPFEEAFPTLEEAVVDYTEFEYGEKRGEGTFHVRNEGGLMACCNPTCHRGGYEFDRVIHDMVREHATDRKIELRCLGDEGSPKGRKKGRRCACSVEGTIKVKYRI